MKKIRIKNGFKIEYEIKAFDQKSQKMKEWRL